LFTVQEAHTTPKILLLALAFAVTIGSVTSPSANPQNLLIAHQRAMSPTLYYFSSAISYLPTF